MRPTLSPSILQALAILAITQIVGWGTLGLLAVTGSTIARDLNLPITSVFAGSSVFFVAMAFCAPVLVRPFARWGTARVMVAGSAGITAGFVLLASAQEPVVYFASWLVLGIAGAASLSTAAHITLNRIAGPQSKSAIGLLMLVTGLAATVFLPLTGFLTATQGWRFACLCFALLNGLLALPLHILLARVTEAPPAPVSAATSQQSAGLSTTFVLLVAAIACNGFVTFGLSAALVQLLQGIGLEPTLAIAFASSLGIVQVAARAFDLVGGGRWDGLTTSLVATPIMLVAMAILYWGGGALPTVVVFNALYGASSGALAIARSTLPLVSTTSRAMPPPCRISPCRSICCSP